MTIEVKIYSYSACSTCRKALNWLSNNRIEYELIDIVKSPPDKLTLSKALNSCGDKKYLFNTRGQSYRKLGADFFKVMDNDQAIHALANDGKLIKRPLLITSNEGFLLGFNQTVWEDFFKSKIH